MENFVSCCKLSFIEITVMQLEVRMTTVSTNMMFFTGIHRQGKDIMIIIMSNNQFAA